MSGTETREEILAVAARLFERQGIVGTTMRAIAAGCSIKAASLYHHFASKDEIVAEVLWRSSVYSTELHAAARDASLSPAARIEALTRASVASFRAHPEASRVFSENRDYVASAPLLKKVRASARAIETQWLEALADAMRDGAVRAGTTPERLWAMLRDLMLAGAHTADDARVDEVVQLLLHGILTPPASSPQQ